MAAQDDKIITPDELLELPDDGIRREIHDGVLVEMSPSGDIASELGLEIGALIRNHARANKLGRPIGSDGGYILSEDPYILLSPDASFIAKERAPKRTGKFYKTAPDLAVEVISPSERADDIHEKVQTYLKYGTTLVWVVYPKTRQIAVYRDHIENLSVLDINGTLDGGDVLPGFTLPVRDIFAVLEE